MPLPRLAIALFATVSLNGSVVLAMTPPGCTVSAHRVCAQPLDGAVQRVNLPEAPMPAPDIPDGWAAELAPPARPADLHLRRAGVAEVPKAMGADTEPPLASLAPPRRPAHLRRAPAPVL